MVQSYHAASIDQLGSAWCALGWKGCKGSVMYLSQYQGTCKGTALQCAREVPRRLTSALWRCHTSPEASAKEGAVKSLWRPWAIKELVLGWMKYPDIDVPKARKSAAGGTKMYSTCSTRIASFRHYGTPHTAM